jgi:photosystem II stability/assembly factor-like uncharacterized protein
METMIYVAIGDSVLTVRDSGDHSTESSFTAKSCRCVATDPAMHGRAYLGAGNGLWRTDDGGSTWEVVHGIPRGRRVTAIAVSGRGRGRDGSDVVYIGTEPSALFQSTDGGASWDELPGLAELPSAPTWSFPPHPETHHVRWIAVDPVLPARLFVAIEAGALVHSDDGGLTWHDRVSGGPLDTHTLVIHPRSSEHLYSAAGDGYFESHDGGATWSREELGLRHRYAWGCVVDPQDPGTVIISASKTPMMAHAADGAESWIYRRARGAAWAPVPEGLPDPTGTTVSALAIDPVCASVVYAANNRGVFRSDDMGETWRRLDVAWPDRLLRQRVAGIAVGL